MKRNDNVKKSLEYCINELKRSSLLALGPQTSVRQVFDSNGNGSLIDAKSLFQLVPTQSENQFLLLIHEACEAFYERNKTGVSTLVSYICILLNGLKEVECTHTIELVLDRINSAMIDSVNALCLRCPRCSNKVATNQDVQNLDDVSWFFAGSEDNVNLSSVFSPDVSLENSTIFKGLEHCLSWDFSAHSTQTDQLSLPMKIASSTLSHLLSRDINTITTSLEAPHCKGFSKDITYEIIQGKNTAETVAHYDTIIEFCDSDDLDKYQKKARSTTIMHTASQGTRVYSSYSRAINMKRQHSNSASETKGLCNVAIVEMTVPCDDKSPAQLRISGSGSSQHADDIQERLRNVHYADVTSGDRLVTEINKTKAYTQRAYDHMKDLNVQVLLCPYSVPLKLLDICFENGICVIPMSTDNLYNMAKMLECSMVEDILDLQPHYLGCRENVVHEKRKFLQVEQKYASRINLDSPGEKSKSSSSIMFVIRVCSLDDMTIPKHVSVVIPCPTAVIGDIFCNRIQKCIARLEALVYKPRRGSTCMCLQSRVIPGGGLAEILCSMQLSRSKSKASKEVRAIDGFLDIVINQFSSFSDAININCGYSPAASMEKWSECTDRLQKDFGGIDMTEYFSSLDTMKKLELPSPILSFDPNFPTFDIASIKLEAIAAACYTVKAILMVFHTIEL